MRTDGASVTIIGRAATDPQLTSAASGDRVRFRVLAVERRLDEATKEWVDGDEFGVNVVGWGKVAKGVLETVRKGDPLVVIGRISTRRVERNETVDYFTDVRADVVALDAARMNGRFRRVAPVDRVTEPADQPSDDPFAIDVIGHGVDSAADPARSLVTTG